MGAKSSLMLQDEEIKIIGEETGFSGSQIEKLYSRFAHLDRGNCGTLSKSDFLSIPELAINPLCDRIVQMFFSDYDREDERINFRQFMSVLALFKSGDTSKKGNNYSLKGDLNPKNDPHDATKMHSSPIMRNSRLQATTYDRMTNFHIPVNDEGKRKFDGQPNEGLETKLLFVFNVYDADNDGRISFNDLRSILKMMVGDYIEDVQLDKIATRAFVEVDEDGDGFIEFSEFCKVFSVKDLDDKLRVKFFN